LLLGVDYTACTAFHLAEYRLPWVPPDQVYHCFTLEEGRRAEREFIAAALDDSDFALLGAELEAKRAASLRKGRVGSGTGRLLSLRAAVDFGVGWLTVRRRPKDPGQPLSHCSYSTPMPTMVPSTDGAGRRAISQRLGFPGPGIAQRYPWSRRISSTLRR
jgi:aminoglycoside 3-N-acetyltransferase